MIVVHIDDNVTQDHVIVGLTTFESKSVSSADQISCQIDGEVGGRPTFAMADNEPPNLRESSHQYRFDLIADRLPEVEFGVLSCNWPIAMETPVFKHQFDVVFSKHPFLEGSWSLVTGPQLENKTLDDIVGNLQW